MPPKGFKHSKESIEKMRKAKLGGKHSPEHILKMKQALKGKKRSDETKAKMSKSRLGIKLSEETKNKLKFIRRGINNRFGYRQPEDVKLKIRHTLLGRKLSKETREKMRNKIISFETRMKMSIRMKGENNPLWKGGITNENKLIRGSFDFHTWKMNVFQRDNFTCQECGAKSEKGKRVNLNAHHIMPFAQFPKLRFDISNGIALCQECHWQIHSKKEVTKYAC